MTSQDKLIKQGIKYTDRLFDEVSKRIEKGVRQSDTLEEFLVKYHKAFPEKGNPMVSLGYDKEMLDIILSETNNHKFSRPSQKELVRVTIENQVGDLLVDVGDEVKESVRSIVSEGYDNNLSQDEIAENISNRVGVIKNKRARAIARTEIARTATISDYIVNKEHGATGWYVECRNTACPVCKNAWHKGWTLENDDGFKPSDTSAGGKGWIGDRIFSMNDTGMLPPIHPNCRCVVYYTTEEPNVSTEPVQQTTSTTVEEPTKETVEEEIIGSDSNSMLKGEPTVYTEKDIVNGSKVTVYKYENGFEIAVNENAALSHDEIVSHINSLPDALKNLPELKRINIKDWQSANAGGEYRVAYQDINVYAYPGSSKVSKLNTFTHELAHARDFNGTLVNNLSLKEIYEKIFKADNKLYTYVKPNGRKKTPKKFPTDYAARSFVKYGKDFKKRLKIWEKGTKTVPKPSDKTFSEDFAESSMLYLNPTTYDQFVKDFPNRAEYLESIYGEPKFDKNSPLYKALNEEGLI